MKKVLLFVLVLTALKATAQVPTPTVMTESKNNSLFQTTKKSNLTIKRAAAEGWFDPAEASAAFNSFPLDFTSGNLNVNAVWADSAIYFAYTDGYNGPQTMGAGMIFDPRNPIYAGAPYNTTKYTTYIVDSIELNYLYTRKNMDPNILDKVNFYAFKNTDMFHYLAEPFATVGYDKVNNIPTGTGVKKLYTQSLGVLDSSTGGNISSMKFACNEKVNGSNTTGGSNWFGIYFNYEPGTTYPKVEPFDTVGFNGKDVSGNKHNRFQYVACTDPSGPSSYPSDTSGTYKSQFSKRIYNNGVFVVDFVRYSTLASPTLYGYSWTRNNLPIIRFPYFRFHVTTNNLAVKNSSKEVTLVEAYPNPAAANSEVVLSMTANKATTAVITVTDMSGKVVKTMNAEIVDGKNNITISTNALSNGMYLVNVAGEGFQSSSKLVIE
jgi:hypothetical protein